MNKGTLRRFAFHAMCVLAITFVCNGCGDSPIYRTPLPNGYVHESNGGESGQIAVPTSSTSSRPVAPSGTGLHNRDRYMNDFGWAGNLVVGEVIEYGDRGLEVASRQYMIFDTLNGSEAYFDSLIDVQTEWRKRTQSPFPSLVRNHPGRKKVH